SSNPSGAASAATRRRASAMPLVSSTGITICSELPRVTGSFPARDRHARPAPRPRIDGKFIAQALGAPQPQAEPAAGRKAVLQRELDVCDARALVDERQAQAPARALGERLDLDLAAAAVDHGVARELARGRDDLGLVHQAEPDGLRLLAQELPCPHDVLRRAHRELDAAGGGALRGPSRDHRDVQARTSSSRRCSSAMPFSTFSAVCTPSSGRPSSTRVIATDGCIPTTTVCASSTRAIAEMFAIMRPMNESTTSSAEMSIRTPRERSFEIFAVRSSCSVRASWSCMSTWIVTAETAPSSGSGCVPSAALPGLFLDLPAGALERDAKSVGERRLGDHLAEIHAQVHDGLRDLRPDAADDAVGAHQA